MGSLPVFEGPQPQVLDGHPRAESMGKALDQPLPTPPHAVGTTEVHAIIDRADPDAPLAAHVASLGPVEAAHQDQIGPSNMPDVAIVYI